MLFSTPILDMAIVMKGVRTWGGTLLYQPYTYLLPQRVWFMGRFGGLKTLCPFSFGMGYGFQGTYGSVHVLMYLSFSVLNE